MNCVLGSLVLKSDHMQETGRQKMLTVNISTEDQHVMLESCRQDANSHGHMANDYAMPDESLHNATFEKQGRHAHIINHTLLNSFDPGIDIQ